MADIFDEVAPGAAAGGDIFDEIAAPPARAPRGKPKPLPIGKLVQQDRFRLKSMSDDLERPTTAERQVSEQATRVTGPEMHLEPPPETRFSLADDEHDVPADLSARPTLRFRTRQVRMAQPSLEPHVNVAPVDPGLPPEEDVVLNSIAQHAPLEVPIAGQPAPLEDLIVKPFEQMAGAGREKLRQAADFYNVRTRREIHGDTSQGPTTPAEATELEQNPTTGIDRAVAGTVGGLAADPRQWPFLFQGAAREILRRAVSAGFAAQMGESAVEGAGRVGAHWDDPNISPAQRVEEIADPVLAAGMAAGAGLHAVKPKVAPPVPEAEGDQFTGAVAPPGTQVERPAPAPEPELTRPANPPAALAPPPAPAPAPDILQGRSTQEAYTDPFVGDYIPERRALHEHVLEQILAGHQPSGKQPVIYVLGGGTASGKTTLSRQILEEDPNVVRLDPDEMKLRIPEYEHIKKTDPMKAPFRVHDESSYLNRRALDMATQRGLDIVYDTTTSGAINGKLGLVQELKKRGYRVELLFADAPIEEAIKRADKRARDSKDPINRGRFVPHEVIRANHQSAAANFLTLRDHADTVHLLDTTGREPKLIYSRAGQDELIPNPERWEQYQAKARGEENAPAIEAPKEAAPAGAVRGPGPVPDAGGRGPTGEVAGGQGDIFDQLQPGPSGPGAAAGYRAVKGSEVVHVPLSEIEIEPERFQPRGGLNKERVSLIAGNMRRKGEFGDQEPVDVWETPEGKLKLMAGHHRHAAAGEAGLDYAAARIRRGLTAEQAVEFARQSNSKAAPLTPMEHARAFKVEKAAGKSADQIGHEYGGLKPNQVEDLLSLNDLAPKLQDYVQQGVFDAPRAIVLAKAAQRHAIPEAIQEQAYDYVIKRREITPAQFTKLLDTFAPAASQQGGFEFGNQAGFEGMVGFKGLASVMDEYLGKMRELNRSSNRLRGFVNEIERKLRKKEVIHPGDLKTKGRMKTEIRRLEKELKAMEEKAGKGEVFKTLGSELEAAKAQEAASGTESPQELPAVQPPQPELTSPRAAKPDAGRPPTGEDLTVESPRGLAGEPELEGARDLGAAAKRKLPQVQPPTLPGMEQVPAERAEARAEAEGQELTDRLVRPPESVSKRTGELERESPLFRDTEASGQKGLFGEPEVKPPGGEGEGTLFAHVNPLVPLGKAWTRLIGEPAWKAIERGWETALGKTGLAKFLLTRYGQPAEYREAAGARKKAISEQFEAGEQLGGRLSKGLDQFEQQALGRMITGKATEADLQKLRGDARWFDAIEAAKLARQQLDDLGSQAVTQKLLQQETFFRNHGKYMPRLYRKYELDYEGLAKQFREKVPTRLEMSRWKKRQDIPEGIRAMMGEIKEPAYPVAKGIAQMGHDVETQKFFKFVADKADWTQPDAKAITAAGLDPGDFTELPTTKKLGPLSGKYVLNAIADDLNQIIRVPTQIERISRALVTEWKFGKVVLSVATHFRNMYSNLMLAYAGGLPITRLDIYAKALFDLRNRGKWYQEASQAGDFLSGTHGAVELDNLLDSWNQSRGSLLERMATVAELVKQGRPAEAFQHLRPSQTELGQKASRIYQAEEKWFKLAKYIHNREKGMTPAEAAADAAKWLFDYSEVPRFVDWARRSPFGAPFITFTYKALPVLAESAIKYPWRIGAMVGSLYALNAYARHQLGMSPGQERELNRIMPDRMKGRIGPKFVLLPWKDKYGQLQFLDLSYILPWGDVAEVGTGTVPSSVPVLSSPLKAIFEVSVNKSDFTGKEIYKETDTKAEAAEKVSLYLWRTAAPTLAPGGYGFTRLVKAVERKPDYFGRTSSPVTAIASTIFGLKTTPLDVSKERHYRNREYEDKQKELDMQRYNLMRNRGLSPDEKRDGMREINRKKRELRANRGN